MLTRGYVQYVDKTTLSYAAIFGFKKDLHLDGDQVRALLIPLLCLATDSFHKYSWLSSVFYLGWLFWALPANMLLQKAPPAYYLGMITALSGRARLSY